MKAVLMAFSPKECEKIFSGEKTVDVRKVAPKLEAPYKVYMYETQGATETPRVDEDGHFIWKGLGKVVGEFVCDRKYDIRFTGASLHITAPKRYDTPKELGEFRRPDVWYKTETDNTSALVHETGETITRAPQSWMYVEEIEE